MDSIFDIVPIFIYFDVEGYEVLFVCIKLLSILTKIACGISENIKTWMLFYAVFEIAKAHKDVKILFIDKMFANAHIKHCAEYNVIRSIVCVCV